MVVNIQANSHELFLFGTGSKNGLIIQKLPQDLLIASKSTKNVLQYYFVLQWIRDEASNGALGANSVNLFVANKMYWI